MYFENYGFRTPWLDKRLKSPLSENPSKCNMENGPKYCSNLNHSSFSIIIDQCEGKLSWKKPLLVTCKILGLFVNKLSTSDTFSLPNETN